MARSRASETVIDTVLAPPDAPVKRGRGRPFGKKQTVEAGSVDLDYSSKTTLTFNTFEDFSRFVAGYPDKRGILLYVYRLVPVINMRQVGTNYSNIDKIEAVGDMTRAYIESKHGGGRYQLKLTDINRADKLQRVADTYLEIDMGLVEPILDLGSLVIDDPRKNQGYIQTQIAAGNLVRDELGRVQVKSEATFQQMGEKLQRQAAAAAPQVGQVAPVQTGQPDFMQQLILEILRNRSGGAAAPEDSGKRIQEALLLADRLHPKNPLENTLVETLISRALNPAPVTLPAPPEDMLANYERMDALLSKLGVGRGVSAPDTGNQVLSIVQGIVQALPLGIQIFQQMRTAAGPGIAAGPVPVAGLGGGFVPGPVPLVPVNDWPVENAAGVGNEAGGDPMMRLLDPAFRARVEQVGRKALEVYSRGVSGFDYAAALSSMEPDGDELIDCFRKLGTANVMNFITASPNLSALVADPVARVKLSAWFDDFLMYDPHTLDESDDEPGPDLDGDTRAGG